MIISFFEELLKQYRTFNFWTKLSILGALASIIGLIVVFFSIRKHLGGKVWVQQGTIQVRTTGYYEVFYPVSYENPPELTWPKTKSGPSRELFTIIEQRKDGFKIHVDWYSSRLEEDLKWKAKGKPLE